MLSHQKLPPCATISEVCFLTGGLRRDFHHCLAEQTTFWTYGRFFLFSMKLKTILFSHKISLGFRLSKKKKEQTSFEIKEARSFSLSVCVGLERSWFTSLYLIRSQGGQKAVGIFFSKKSTKSEKGFLSKDKKFALLMLLMSEKGEKT